MIDLSTIEARKAIVSKWASRCGLDLALVCSVCEHESSWNTWSCRYEPAFYSKYIQPMIDTGFVRTITEAQSRSTSYGLMQVMGQVAREHGFAGKYLTELCDPDVGVDYGCRKLQKCSQNNTDIRKMLLAYNGGGDPNYPDLVLQFMSKYQ